MRSLVVGTTRRTWRLYRPRRAIGRPLPLIVCFHGGTAGPVLFAHATGLLAAADRHGFVMAFPEALDGWEDARLERGGGTGDLDFVDALVATLADDPGIDQSRVYALGASNGGMFVMRLACERPGRFAGFATLLAGLPAVQVDTAPPGPPVPIALVFALGDRIMPAGGGEVHKEDGFGVGGMILSSEATVAFWVKRNGAGEAKVTTLRPGRTVHVRDYSALPGGAPVRSVEIDDWRHKWPRWAMGDSDSEEHFDATDLIWSFFGSAVAALPS